MSRSFEQYETISNVTLANASILNGFPHLTQQKWLTSREISINN